MTDEEERKHLLSRITAHTDLDYSKAPTERLRRVAVVLEEGARAIAENRRMAALADGWARPAAGDETPDQ